MTTILQLNSSASGEASVTNSLNDLLVSTIGPDATVVRRDLTGLPALSNQLLVANNTPEADRTPEQNAAAALADEVIAELESADVVVIGNPLYNFGVASGLKAWMDLIARAGRTFTYTETGPAGLVSGDKKVYVNYSSGGVDIGTAVDFATPHLQTFLGFLGLTDITVINAGGLLGNPGNLDAAKQEIQQLAAA